MCEITKAWAEFHKTVYDVNLTYEVRSAVFFFFIAFTNCVRWNSFMKGGPQWSFNLTVNIVLSSMKHTFNTSNITRPAAPACEVTKAYSLCKSEKQENS